MLSQPWFLNDPSGVAVHGNVVYVSDSLNGRVNKYTSDGQLITSLRMQYPFGLTVDAGANLYVADEEGIAKYDSTGALVTFIPTQEGPPPGEAQPVSPADVAVGEGGDIYVVSRHRLLVQQYDANGQFVRQWGEGADNQEGAVRNGIAVGVGGNIYVSDFAGDKVKVYTPEGVWLFDFPQPAPIDGPTGFDGPAGLAIDDSGFVYVADLHNARVLRFTSEGVLDTQWGIGSLADPSGVARDHTGNIYVTEQGADRIHKFTSNGQHITQWCTSGSAPGLFFRPEALDVANNGKVYVGDRYNLRVQVFSESANSCTSGVLRGILNRAEG